MVAEKVDQPIGLASPGPKMDVGNEQAPDPDDVPRQGAGRVRVLRRPIAVAALAKKGHRRGFRQARDDLRHVAVGAPPEDRAMPIDADGKNKQRELGATMPAVGRRDAELKAGEQGQHRGQEVLERMGAGRSGAQARSLTSFQGDLTCQFLTSEHFLLQTEDLEATKDWYIKVLGFRVGPSPDFKFPVYWLYLGDRDVLHITAGGKNMSENRKKYVGQQSEAVAGTGVVDHIGFRTTGLARDDRESDKNTVSSRSARSTTMGFITSLFDPNGVKIELNFANAEAKGRKPEL